MCNNILEILLNNGENNPDDIAFIDEECTYTWRNVVQKVQSIATALLSLGICKPNANKPVPILMKKSASQIC